MAARKFLRTLCGLAGAWLCGAAMAGANVLILNGNAPGEGFNDPTPASPVGGNPGTTLGQQRLNVLLFAASQWASRLDSNSTIAVYAVFAPLFCQSNAGYLGQSGPVAAYANFPNAPYPNTWYGAALANKLAGFDLDGNTFYPEIQMTLNSLVGTGGCFGGESFYLGLDGNSAPSQFALVQTIEHELAHGLGFLDLTDLASGQLLFGLPTVYDLFLMDNTLGKAWAQMTDSERLKSAATPLNLVFTGPRVTAGAPSVLRMGTPKLTIKTPAAIAGDYVVSTAPFGPPFSTIDLTRQAIGLTDGPLLTDACSPLSPDNARQALNRIAVVFSGGCDDAVKARNAQNAGAAAVIVADVDRAGVSPPVLTGSDSSIRIPAVGMTNYDLYRISQGVSPPNPSLRTMNVVGRLHTSFSQLSGADPLGRPYVYTPVLLQPLSSVSHWDVSAFPNQLMEPSIESDTSQQLEPPFDLTLPALLDLGW